MSWENLFFWVFALGSLLGALGVVLLRDPVKGALSLISSFFSIACLYLLQHAELLAVLEVLVYAGAIMVLFVFVIMLVENHADPIGGTGLAGRIGTVVKPAAVFLVAANMIVVIVRSPPLAAEPLPEGFGSALAVGRAFFTQFLFHFELASVLLLVAIVGAVILSREDKPQDAEAES